ncbi:MAG: hypothetical protein AB1546_01075, partial [bacterium]
CIPEDKTPPQPPQAESPDYDQYTCTPRWQTVIDKDPVRYSVYRCDDKQTVCTTEAQFAAIASDLSGTNLSYLDDSVETNATYTYCITAKDPSGNESAVIAAGNCRQCTPGNKPLDPCDENPDYCCPVISNNPIVNEDKDIQLIDNDGNELKIDATYIEGIIVIKLIHSDIKDGKTYTLRIHFPTIELGTLCDNSEFNATGKCVVIPLKDITSDSIKACTADEPIYVRHKIDGIGKGGSEIGDADCDGEVGFNDLKELKKSYKKKTGDAEYSVWADFSGDGTVGFDDLKILKKNYKMIIYGSDQIDRSDANFCKPSQ